MTSEATDKPRAKPTSVLIVRFSPEISTKARTTRLRFVRKLARNLHGALAATGARFEIERQWSRLVVHIDHPDAVEAASRVFGVHSVSTAVSWPWSSLEEILELGREHFQKAVTGKTFAVRVKRVDPGSQIDFRSVQVERELGSALFDRARGVDLKNPEVTAHVELHPDRVYFFSNATPAHGGLPLGIDSRALSLVSGGFDSAVASWQLLRRGVALHYLFFNLGGTIHHLGTSRVLQVLSRDWSCGYRPKLYVVDLREALDDLKKNSSSRYWQVLLKRLMLRGADRVAEEIRMQAFVMGDAIGQVSSQTLENIAVISEATSRPILRPLIAANKQEIIDQAKAIGTYELSAAVGEFCALDAKSPTTKAPLADLLAAEERFDISLLDRAVAEREELDLRDPQPVENEIAHLGVDHVPEDAVVVDLRSKDAFNRWHYRGAVHLGYENALRTASSLPDAKRYLFYCEVGLKSVHLAEILQARGIEARYFEGGASDLQCTELGNDPLANALRAPAALTD